MPDFNKGDFTQQGVNGHVNANVRLNEKRLVNIDLTSDEEAEGCTITGTVKDLLNDKVYNIGSGVSGNIEITENGENINVAPYATATVNVPSSGGLPTLTATIINTSEFGMQYFGSASYKAEYGAEPITETIQANATVSREFLYTYEALIYYVDVEYGSFEAGPGTTVTVEYSNLVNCTLVVDDNRLVITDPSENSSATLTLTIQK